MAFNREYMPLGWNTKSEQESIHGEEVYSQYPIHTSYKKLDEDVLLRIAGNEAAVRRRDDSSIYLVFLYDERCHPRESEEYWNVYMVKLKLLSRLLTTRS